MIWDLVSNTVINSIHPHTHTHTPTHHTCTHSHTHTHTYSVHTHTHTHTHTCTHHRAWRVLVSAGDSNIATPSPMTPQTSLRSPMVGGASRVSMRVYYIHVWEYNIIHVYMLAVWGVGRDIPPKIPWGGYLTHCTVVLPPPPPPPPQQIATQSLVSLIKYTQTVVT